MVVAVPWASINPISSGRISGRICSKHRWTLNTCPAGLGAAMAFPLPSELEPMELMTPRIWFLSLMASFILFKTKTTAPSPRINPSARSSKGNEPVADKVPIFANPIKDSGARWVLTPPTTTWSCSPDKSSPAAASRAVTEEAQAASTT